MISPFAQGVVEMEDLQPGDPRWIGPYWLEGRLAAGGMGRVYLGRSPGGRHVAIKVIRAELAGDAEFRNRFAREVAAARKVSGIFTADVVDADVTGPTPWLATSYVAGPSLADAVAARGPLSPAAVLELAAGLAEGLVAIHSAGVVHRDLKPSNVLLAEDGPRLIDFGIARAMETSALTQTGMVIGSPGFMSPEQARGGDVGPPSDIFSLGAVLAFAATSQGPFGEGSGPSLLYRVVSSEPDTSQVPGEIRPVVERCLAKDPRRRPTAAQLLAELTNAAPPTRTAPALVPGGVGRTATLLPPPATEQASPATERAHPAAELVHPGAAPETRRAPVPAPRPPAPAERRPPAEQRSAAPPRPRFVATPEPRPLAAPQPPPPWRQPVAPRSRPPRRAWPIAVAVAVVLIATAAGAFTARHYLSRPSPGTTLSPSSPGSSTPPQSPAAVMTVLGTYLARSASVRPTVQPAIDGVRTCSQAPASGQAVLQQAINTRQDILNGLKTLSPAGLPGGTQLINSLADAMRDSITADQDYQSWMADVASGAYPCGSNPSRNSHYAAGDTASAAATSAKKTFVGIWNPMAPSYGQKTYSDTDF